MRPQLVFSFWSGHLEASTCKMFFLIMFSTLVRGSSASAVLTLTLSDLQAPQPSGPPVGWSTSAGFPSLLFPSRAVGETLPDEQPG